MTLKLFIKVDAICDFTSTNKSRRYLGAALAETLPLNIPIDANLREPNRSNAIFRQIVQTLVETPEDFFSSNLGLRIVAEEVIYEYDVNGNPVGIWVVFIPDKNGMLNGGHTLKAISVAKKQGADLSNARVPFLIETGIKDEKIAKLCISLNSASKVDKRSMLNKMGIYDELKFRLEADNYKNVAYYQNQKGVDAEDRRCHISHVVSLLSCLDNKRYNYGQGDHPISIIKGGGGYTGERSVQRAIELYGKLFDGAFKIEKHLHELVKSHSFHSGFNRFPGIKEAPTIRQHSHLIDGTSYPILIPSNIALPVVGAFRVFIDDGEWVMPFDSFGIDLTSYLWSVYKDLLEKEFRRGCRSINPYLSQPPVWEALCRSALQYYTRMLKMKRSA